MRFTISIESYVLTTLRNGDVEKSTEAQTRVIFHGNSVFDGVFFNAASEGFWQACI